MWYKSYWDNSPSKLLSFNVYKELAIVVRYIDDVLPLHFLKFGDFVKRTYPIKPEIKDTTDTVQPVLHHNLHLEIDGFVESKTERQRYDFSYPMNFRILHSSI